MPEATFLAASQAHNMALSDGAIRFRVLGFPANFPALTPFVLNR
jgi:hypothetical protein